MSRIYKLLIGAMWIIENFAGNYLIQLRNEYNLAEIQMLFTLICARQVRRALNTARTSTPGAGLVQPQQFRFRNRRNALDRLQDGVEYLAVQAHHRNRLRSRGSFPSP